MTISLLYGLNIRILVVSLSLLVEEHCSDEGHADYRKIITIN